LNLKLEKKKYKKISIKKPNGKYMPIFWMLVTVIGDVLVSLMLNLLMIIVKE
jgi:hypothetical protein